METTSNWPATFAKTTAVQYGRHVHGLTAKQAAFIYDSLPAVRHHSTRMGFSNLHTERACSSGSGSFAVNYHTVSRNDYDNAVRGKVCPARCATVNPTLAARESGEVAK